MIYLFYMAVFFFVVVINTTIIAQLPVFYGFYDLLLLIVIYFGFYRSVRESLPFVILFGLVMDGISGGTFGLYTTSYIWLYIFALWLTRFIRVTNSMILPGVVACGVLIQNAIFLGYMALLDPGTNIPSFSIKIVMIQLAWSVFTGPIFIAFFKTLVYQLEKWQQSFQSDWS
jgi:cell shape-determining protein MreD